MNIGSIGGSAHAYAMQAGSRLPESAEPQKAGPDHDGDADDGASRVQASASSTVNMSGQKLGQLIHVSA